MTIRIHDTLTRKKVDFTPLEPGKASVYVCGPTVYDFLHVGNARPLVAYDVVVRHLRARGFAVNYVRNLTDVDDKIIDRAHELGVPPEELTQRYIDEFHEDVGALCCLPPTDEPRVTETMDGVVALCQTLIERGVAYESQGDVYFNVAAFPDYGALSQQPLDQLEAGARVEVDVAKKRGPLDFALWKAAKRGEPAWPSPWGPGRPGWHIECSAMAERYLGPTFDLHGGGVDLIFPHHENERAQSQGARGAGTFARVWMHNGFVNWGGGKIAKSEVKNNPVLKALFRRAFTMRVVIERHGGEALRLFLLTTQYRNPIAYEIVVDGDDPATAPLRIPGLEEAERRCEYAYLTLERLRDQLAVGKSAVEGKVAPEAEAWLPKLQEALDDDFNTAGALAAWNEALALVNRILDGKLEAPKDVKRRTLERLDHDLRVAADELGLGTAAPRAWLDEHRARRCAQLSIDGATVAELISRRDDARKRKSFAEADTLRAELATLGVEIMDTPKGTTWRVR
jgi:cysteinyl-tRNA synthetase